MADIESEVRVAVLEVSLKQLIAEIKEHRADSKEQHNNLMSKIAEIDKRLQIVERWRWMVVGGAIAIGYIAAHLLK